MAKQGVARRGSRNRGQRSAGGARRPAWDAERHTLSWAGRPVKHFRAAAPQQEAILAAFQAARWKSFIPAKEPAAAGLGRKDRLRDTIANLNRSVRPHLAFRLEGGGTRVCWEPR